MFGKHSNILFYNSPKIIGKNPINSSNDSLFESESETDLYGSYLDSNLEELNKENFKNTINKKFSEKKKKKTIRLSELQDNNLYNILNIDENSTQEEIKKAYKKLVIVNHPDKGGDALKFNKINEAYQILSLPLTKQIYDRFGCKSLKMIRDIINENKLDCDSDFCNIYEQKDLENLKYFFQNDD
jgi:hypothetical protein